MKRERLELPFINNKIESEILKHFTITNPKWLENRKMKRWNRDTPKYLYHYEYYDEPQFDDVKLFVPRGSLPEVLEIYNKHKVDVVVKNNCKLYKELDFEFHGELYKEQKEAVEKVLEYDDVVLCLPPGHGKTVIGLYVTTIRKQSTLIVVPTKELVNQWVKRIKQFLDIDKNEIGICADGKREIGRRITIGLANTLVEMDIPNVGNLILDECHRVPANRLLNVVKKFSGRYILALSATPYRNDGLTKLIYWYAGSLVYIEEEKADIEIVPIIRFTDFHSEMEQPWKNYARLITEVTENLKRNNLITDDVLKVAKQEHSLILSERKKHCYTLQEMLNSKNEELIVEVLTGDGKKEERSAIIDNVERGNVDVLIATSKLIGEGFDCKNLSCLFLTTPIKYFGNLIQYIGRIIRKMEGKEKAIVFDYFDKNVSCFHNGFKQRKKVYDEYYKDGESNMIKEKLMGIT